MNAEITSNVISFPSRMSDHATKEVFQCEPLLTKTQIEDVEETMQSADFALERRLALAMCAMDGQWFEQIAALPKEGAMAVVVNAAAMQAHVEALHALAHVIEQAHARVMVGFNFRNDAAELLAAVQEA